MVKKTKKVTKVAVENAQAVPNTIAKPRSPHPLINQFLATFADNDKFWYFTEDTLMKMLETNHMFLNMMVGNNFKNILTAMLIKAADEKLTDGQSSNNLRFTIEAVNASSETVECILHLYYVDFEVIKYVNEHEFILRGTKIPNPGKGPRAKKLVNEPGIECDSFPFNVSVYEGQLLVGFHGAMGDPSAPLQQKIEPEKNERPEPIPPASEIDYIGIANKIGTPPETEVEVESAQCKLMLGFHPVKGWVMIGRDGDIKPLALLASGESIDELGIRPQFEMLSQTMEYIDSMNKLKEAVDVNGAILTMDRFIGTLLSKFQPK